MEGGEKMAEKIVGRMKGDILAEQTRRGVTDSAVRTKYSSWSTTDPKEVIFELETPISPIDDDRSKLAKLEYSHRNMDMIHDCSFRLTATQDSVKVLLNSALKAQGLHKYMRSLFDDTITHAMYRVQLTVSQLNLSLYAKQPGHDGVGVDICLFPEAPLAMWIAYPTALRDKVSFAVVNFCPPSSMPDEKGLIRLEEYQDIDGADARLIRVVESTMVHPEAGYHIQIKKKEYV